LQCQVEVLAVASCACWSVPFPSYSTPCTVSCSQVALIPHSLVGQMFNSWVSSAYMLLVYLFGHSFFVVLFLLFSVKVIFVFATPTTQYGMVNSPDTNAKFYFKPWKTFLFVVLSPCPLAVMFELVAPWPHLVADLNPKLRLGGKCGPGLQFLLTTNQPTNQPTW